MYVQYISSQGRFAVTYDKAGKVYRLYAIAWGESSARWHEIGLPDSTFAAARRRAEACEY